MGGGQYLCVSFLEKGKLNCPIQPHLRRHAAIYSLRQYYQGQGEGEEIFDIRGIVQQLHRFWWTCRKNCAQSSHCSLRHAWNLENYSENHIWTEIPQTVKVRDMNFVENVCLLSTSYFLLSTINFKLSSMHFIGTLHCYSLLCLLYISLDIFVMSVSQTIQIGETLTMAFLFEKTTVKYDLIIFLNEYSCPNLPSDVFTSVSSSLLHILI